MPVRRVPYSASCRLSTCLCRSSLGVPRWGESRYSASGCLRGLLSARGGRRDVVAVLQSSGLLGLCRDGRSVPVVASGKSRFVVRENPVSSCPTLLMRATPPVYVWTRWASPLRELLLGVADGRHATRGQCRPLGAGMARCLSLALASECALLLATDFGVWAQGLLVTGTASSYDDFAVVDACLLPRPRATVARGLGLLGCFGSTLPCATSFG